MNIKLNSKLMLETQSCLSLHKTVGYLWKILVFCNNLEFSDWNCLYQIISFAKFYFSCKYFRWGAQYALFCGIFYLCALLYNLSTNSRNVVEQDVFIGALISEVLTPHTIALFSNLLFISDDSV